MRIDRESNPVKYFDADCKQIHKGDIVFMNGRCREVYMTEDGHLGTDATNPDWINAGKAVPCEYGIYPFDEQDSPVLVDR